MKTFLILAFAVCGFAFHSTASSSFKIDEAALELAFETSEDLTSELLVPAFTNPFAGSAVSSQPENVQMIAAIIAFAEYFTGVGVLIPIHRLYLGCDGKGFKVVALYCVTLGGFGFLPLVDGLFLLLDDSENKYVNNGKFLMWAGDF